jgi:hypothetical protein
VSRKKGHHYLTLAYYSDTDYLNTYM